MPDNTNGIPENITLDFVKSWVEPRVSAKRLKHIEGVAKVACLLAKQYNCDIFLAELAAWLHDAYKEVKDSELVNKAHKLGIKCSELEKNHGHLLHGPVAAASIQHILGITNPDVLSAIAEHTLGHVPMCKLSEVLYLADCLEESRPQNYTGPIWNALDLAGKFDIRKALVVASNLNLMHLIEQGRPIHPRTIEVRNHYLNLMNTVPVLS